MKAEVVPLPLNSEHHKRCIRCEKTFPLSDFNKDKHKRDGLNPYCRICYRKKQRTHAANYRKKHPGSLRAEMLKYVYGIDETIFLRMLVEQGGVCDICKNPPKEKERYCVDHDHSTGKLRGILCKKCNHAIGLFNENIDSCLNAVQYLRKHSR